ncbi:cysteine-rich CWC family protein [Spiribacter insolitus]|uniref:Cysteine-rich CWC family protein n=1 Tax=Spiribacter insolitus TaxID=3122417 RepID=A0ABV3T8T0_9GAMM
MPEHEPKRCPRCGNGFECRQGSIHRCQCVDVMLTDEVRETIAHTYDDCLCRDCLQALAAADSVGDSAADAAGAVAPGVAASPSPITTSKPSPLMPSQVVRERRRQARDAARARSVRPEEVLAALNGLPGRR